MAHKLQHAANEIKTEVLDRLRALGREADARRAAAFQIRFSARLTRAAGLCDYRRREIRLSSSIFARSSNVDGFRNTVLHELAHAALAPGHGHDGAWKSLHRAIGGNAQRCHSFDTGAPSDRRAYCPRCRRDVALGPRRFARMLAGTAEYRHRRCGGTLTASMPRPVATPAPAPASAKIPAPAPAGCNTRTGQLRLF
jgi:predicted SprT family Zn-dependent metalloprotease